jgi:SMP-30/Gluconolactonase/LRE-like region
MSATRQRFRRGAVSVVAAATILAIPIAPAHAQTDVHILVSFDESAGQNPEGIALDRTGDVFVSVSPLGDLWKIPAGTTTPQPFGHVGGIVPGRDFGLLGLAVDVFGNVYGAAQSADPAVDGVWRFDRRTGDAARLPGTNAIAIPNGLAFDRTGNLFVTDSAAGAIWRIPWGGSAQLWLQDAALAGDGSLGLGVPLGANGIAYRNGLLTVTNTEQRTILSITRSGTIDVVATLAGNPDGVAMDVFGKAYVAINLENEIDRVSPGGSVDVLASGDPLDFPSSVAFGTARGARATLFGVNFSLSEAFGLPPGSGPSVFTLDAGAPGMPVA